MTHIPNKFDVITDLRRAFAASMSEKKFESDNFKTFYTKAKENLYKVGLRDETLKLVEKRLHKSEDPKASIQRRQEDLLTASQLIF